MTIINSCPKCRGTLIVTQTMENEDEIRCVTCGLATPTTDNFHKLTGREIILMLSLVQVGICLYPPASQQDL